MRYVALATDFDGTLAHNGRVHPETVDALKTLRKSGRRAILVTGRVLPSLVDSFGNLDLFDLVVLENGAVLYEPQTRQIIPLAAPPPAQFAERLAAHGVTPLEIGEVIVATWQPHEQTVLETIRLLGLELEMIFNKGAVMALPSGVNKASGLKAALERLGTSPHNAAAVGDAENDHAMIHLCELSAAVANALPAVKETADIVLAGDHGKGVVELIGALVADYALGFSPKKRSIVVGRDGDEDIVLPSHFPGTLLIAGQSGSGKSTVAIGLTERIASARYQVCVVDPEGDYDEGIDAVRLGAPDRIPAFEEIESVLSAPDRNVVASLIGLPVDSRAEYFAGLLPRLVALRSTTGRPHWIVLDEAHHLLRAERGSGDVISRYLWGAIAITMQPKLLSQELLQTVRGAIVVGEQAGAVLREAVGTAPEVGPLERGQAALWLREEPERVRRFSVVPPTATVRRHRRKYASGDLAPEKSFYFRGPQNRLNLRAQNLQTFVQMAEGVDDDTWSHHLQSGDIARWFADVIGDESLADAALPGTGDGGREAVMEAIRQRYTV